MDLKKARLKKEMSQVEVAKAVGVHINTYVFWERGVSNPGADNLKKLKKVLDI